MPLLCLCINLYCLHHRPVRSVAVDAISRYLVSGGADSKLAIWVVKSKKCLRTIDLAASVSTLRLHEDSQMVAVALDDFSLIIVDLETLRVVRKFPGECCRIGEIYYKI